MMRRLWIISLVLLALSAGLLLRAQDRLGATIYVQEDTPATAIASAGQFWFVPSTGTLKISTGPSPFTWLDVNTGEAASGEGLPTGAIMFIASGTCPTGYAEETSLNGKAILGTVAANADIGTTGGSDSITPAGTNSAPTFAGNALGTHAHGTGTIATSAHAGTAVADHASHTHTYTDVIAHTHTIPVGATDDTAAPFDRADAGTNASGANATTATGSTGVATGTTAGPSAALTHSVTQPSAHTLSGSSEAVTAGTPSGTNSAPTFSGTQFDNRSAYLRMIACRKT